MITATATARKRNVHRIAWKADWPLANHFHLLLYRRASTDTTCAVSPCLVARTLMVMGDSLHIVKTQIKTTTASKAPKLLPRSRPGALAERSPTLGGHEATDPCQSHCCLLRLTTAQSHPAVEAGAAVPLPTGGPIESPMSAGASRPGIIPNHQRRSE